MLIYIILNCCYIYIHMCLILQKRDIHIISYAVHVLMMKDIACMYIYVVHLYARFYSV